MTDARTERERSDDAPEPSRDPDESGTMGSTEEQSSENRRSGLEHDRERARDEHDV